MHNCLTLRSHSTARINLHRIRHNLLNTQREIIHGKEIPANTLPLVKESKTISDEVEADLIIKNASVINKKSDEFYCIGIKGESIICVGVLSAVEKFIGTNTRIIDVEGKSVLPGFCDSHFHLMVGMERLQGLSVEDVKNSAEFQEKLKNFSQENPQIPAIHVYGVHYLEPAIIPCGEARLFLDKIVEDRPVFVYAHDLHSGWANTKAIEIAGLLRKMPPFPRIISELDLEKNIELSAGGIPSGEFREPETYFLVEGPLRKKYPLTADQKLDYLSKVLAYLSSLGITSIHNMGLALPEEDIELLLLLLELEQKEQLPVRVHCAYSIVPDEHMLTDIYYASQIRDKLNAARLGNITTADLHQFLIECLEKVAELRDEHTKNLALRYPHLKNHKHLPFIQKESSKLHSHIHKVHVASHLERAEERIKSAKSHHLQSDGLVEVGGVKIFMDGIIEKDTAFRLDQKPLNGIPAFNQQELDLVLEKSDQAGLQVAAHCIGDGSVKSILNAVEKARNINRDIDQQRGHQIRHRIEHIELCDPNDITRFAKLNVTPSMQPLHERPPTTMWHQKVPQEKWQYAFPWRSLLDTGVNLSFGSDWPIVSCNCLEGMERAVNRKPWLNDLPDQHLSKTEVMEAFSIHPSFLEYHEHLKGDITPGMFADLTILNENIHQVKPEALPFIKKIRVFSRGKTVFEQ